MTIDHKEAIPQRAGSQSPGPLPVPLPTRDVRRTRPPLMAFLLRGGAIRTLSRVIILLALDFVGLCAALFTATTVKLALRGNFTLHDAWVNTDHILAAAYLLTVLAFARLDLYSDRPRRPGFAKVATGLFQAMLLGALFSLAEGDHFSSYFIFYGSLLFAIAYISLLREVYTQMTGRLLEQVGYRRRAVLVGSGKHINDLGPQQPDRFGLGPDRIAEHDEFVGHRAAFGLLQREAVDQLVARPVELVDADEAELERRLIEIEAGHGLMFGDARRFLGRQQAEAQQRVADRGVGRGTAVVDRRRSGHAAHCAACSPPTRSSRRNSRRTRRVQLTGTVSAITARTDAPAAWARSSGPRMRRDTSSAMTAIATPRPKPATRPMARNSGLLGERRRAEHEGVAERDQPGFGHVGLELEVGGATGGLLILRLAQVDLALELGEFVELRLEAENLDLLRRHLALEPRRGRARIGPRISAGLGVRGGGRPRELLDEDLTLFDHADICRVRRAEFLARLDHRRVERVELRLERLDLGHRSGPSGDDPHRAARR